MKKVLIVDDEQSILTLLKYSLEKEGYEVIQAEDGQAGLELAHMNINYTRFSGIIKPP